MKQTQTKTFKGLMVSVLAAVMLMGCSAAGSAKTTETAAAAAETAAATAETTVPAAETSASYNMSAVESSTEYFTERDLQQTADLTNAVKYTVEDGQDIKITEEGVYVLSGTASEVTVTVEAADDAKVQIVLDGVSITNKDFPAIYVINADKVFVTTTDSENTLSVTGTFTQDGTTNTDAVIFAKDDIVLNGTGTLTVNSTENGVSCKNDLKVTGGTYNMSVTSKAFEAEDSILIADGTFNIKAGTDGLHAEDDEDDTTGMIYIENGTFTISCGDDAIHATTTIVIDGGTFTIDGAEGIEATNITINDGDLTINASDDGINAGRKSTAETVAITINGGTITVNMGAGDTDAIDSNGDITVNGGTIDITAQSPFDCDGNAQYNGGTIIVNGETVNAITNQMMGGMGGMRGMRGNMQGTESGQMPSSGTGEMPQGQMPSSGTGEMPQGQMPQGKPGFARGIQS